jgi:hypothetical protein
MAVQTKCPDCKNRYTLADNLVGKKIRCQACKTVFEVQPAEQVAAKPPPRPKNAVAAGAPSRRREVDEVEEIEDDDDRNGEDRPRKKKRRREREKSSAALWVVSIIFGILGFVGAFVIVFLLVRSRPAEVAKGPPPANVAPANQPAGNQPAANPAGNQPMNPPANQPNNPPMNQNPVAKAPAGNPVAPADLYGDQGGEEVAPADAHAVGTLLRARKEDTFYRLSNPRLGRPKFGPGQALLVDYEMTRRGKFTGGSLYIHGADGRKTQVLLSFFGNQERNTIEVTTIGGPFAARFPENCELYMTRSDSRWGHLSPTFKVSNSVIMGAVPNLTKARNWTQEEIDRYTKDPPNYLAYNQHAGVGQDTPFVGDKGMSTHRYVEPNGHLLGLDYDTFNWQNEQSIRRLAPVFTRDQPLLVGAQRVIAKDGYAIGSVEVQHTKHINGLKLHFYRLKGDGSLDAADTYASELIGFAGKTQQKLGGDGTRMIGINVRAGAVVDALAFVTK